MPNQISQVTNCPLNRSVVVQRTDQSQNHIATLAYATVHVLSCSESDWRQINKYK